MNPPENPPSVSPLTSKREVQLQGPRPAPLRISKDSHKIRKPPKPPVHHQQQPPPLANHPLIIYSVSPKPIHVDASNFMSIVQQLTGRDSDFGAQSSGDVPVSPAARMAAIERSSPREGAERRRGADVGMGNDEVLMGLDIVDVDVDAGQSQMPGILSPAPANLPAISSGLFSPAAEGQTPFGFSDLMMSPFMGNNPFLPSPSSMFLSVSPTPSPGGEFFNIFDF